MNVASMALFCVYAGIKRKKMKDGRITVLDSEKRNKCSEKNILECDDLGSLELLQLPTVDPLDVKREASREARDCQPG